MERQKEKTSLKDNPLSNVEKELKEEDPMEELGSKLCYRGINPYYDIDQN